MINLCFLSGTVKNEIDLQFIYNLNAKNLSKKHTSIVWIDLEIEKEQIVKCYAYDEMADWIYQNIQKEDDVLLRGNLKTWKIEIVDMRTAKFVFFQNTIANESKKYYNKNVNNKYKEK